MPLIGSTIDLYPRPGSGVAAIPNARVLDEDDIGVTVEYTFTGKPVRSFIPWSVVGRLNLPIEAAA